MRASADVGAGSDTYAARQHSPWRNMGMVADFTVVIYHCACIDDAIGLNARMWLDNSARHDLRRRRDGGASRDHGIGMDDAEEIVALGGHAFEDGAARAGVTDRTDAVRQAHLARTVVPEHLVATQNWHAVAVFGPGGQPGIYDAKDIHAHEAEAIDDDGSMTAAAQQDGGRGHRLSGCWLFRWARTSSMPKHGPSR